MYALFQHFATTHRAEMLAFIAFLETNSTVIDAALNDTSIGLTVPAAGKFTSLLADSLGGAAVQANPADATVGKLLQTGAGGLLTTNPPTLSDPTKLDVPTGIYSIAAADGWPFDGTLLQLRRNAGRGLQIAARGSSSAPNASSEIQVRTSGNSFGGWARLIHTENLVGTVSQSGGKPTGAVIERGSNANGEYTRFADGTQICTARRTVTYATGQAMTTTWTFPASFASNPQISIAIDEDSFTGSSAPSIYEVVSYFDILGLSSVRLALGRINGMTSFVSGNSSGVDALAIGRWF